MSESVHPSVGGRCADCPAGEAGYGAGYAAGAYDPASSAEPVPVLGPYIGLVGAVLCSLVGAFLLLAPYAFDYRDGASAVPHSSVVDLATGGGVLLVGLVTAGLFGGALSRRLRPPRPLPALEPLTLVVGEAEAEAGFEGAAEPGAAVPEAEEPHRAAPVSEPEPHPAAPAASLADPGGALRDLLTPLVAALAADLRAREGGDTEGKHS